MKWPADLDRCSPSCVRPHFAPLFSGRPDMRKLLYGVVILLAVVLEHIGLQPGQMKWFSESMYYFDPT
jgi:hypothetical protein